MDINVELIVKDLMNNPEIKKFIVDNKIPDEQVYRDVLALHSYCRELKYCDGCTCLEECNQHETGKKPVLYYDGRISYDYEYCPFLRELNNKVEKKNNLTCLACNLSNVSSSDLIIKPCRSGIINKMISIYEDKMKGNSPKGIYLNGPYGCGKSYIMACFADKYASSGKTVIFAYFPDLIRQLKSSITTGLVEDIVEELKETDVLFLDDFGGESLTPYIRDEVLGAVLQDRMENKKLTFITSNLNKEILHNHLAETSGVIDDLRASRIMERIDTLMDFMELKDINYRQNQ